MTLPTRLLAAGSILALAASPARASFLSGDALDTMADILALVVLFVVPAVVIVLFWIVHVLPEKIAHKRHHPQTPAITTLCLLSLVFGGLLWPLAWLWAFTKPVATGSPTAPTRPTSTTTRWPRSTARASCCAKRSRTCARSWRRWRRAAPCRRTCRSLKDELARLALRCPTRVAAAARQGQGGLDGSHPPRHLLVLRLADLHQAEVAALEHRHPGDGGDHPDRRAGGADPAAQHLRAVVVRRARLQVHGADRVAGAAAG